MISISHMKSLSKSKPTDVWCLDSLGKHSMRFDRLSLCSQIKAIPIEDVIAMLTELDNKIMEEYIEHMEVDWHTIIQQKIDKLKGENK